MKLNLVLVVSVIVNFSNILFIFHCIFINGSPTLLHINIRMKSSTLSLQPHAEQNVYAGVMRATLIASPYS